MHFTLSYSIEISYKNKLFHLYIRDIARGECLCTCVCGYIPESIASVILKQIPRVSRFLYKRKSWLRHSIHHTFPHIKINNFTLAKFKLFHIKVKYISTSNFTATRTLYIIYIFCIFVCETNIFYFCNKNTVDQN